MKKLLFFILCFSLKTSLFSQTTQILTGATTITCPQDNTLTLQNSEMDYNYFLRNDDTKAVIGNPQTGTGSALNFQTGNIIETASYHTFAANPSYALEFDGVDDYVEIPHDASLTFSSGVTIEAWVYPTDITTNTHYVIYRKENNADATGAEGRMLLSFQDNGTHLTLGVETAVSGYIELDVDITPVDYINKWSHILAFYDDATGMMRMYVDGVEIDSLEANGTLINPSASKATNAIVGAFKQPPLGIIEPFEGKIASLRIWDKALTTQEEIYQAKNNLFVGDETNLVAYYPFFENTGILLTDNSTNTNDGTINGAVWTAGTTGGIGIIASNTQTITYDPPAVLYVDKNTTGNNTGCDWANAYTSIQDAVNAVAENGQILIAQGIYQEGAEILINKPINIRGGYPTGGGAQDIENNTTIIDGNQAHRVIKAAHSTGILFLEGLTIQNGKISALFSENFSPPIEGAGINTTGNITLNFVKVQNNTITSTFSSLTISSFGGGIYTNSGNIILTNCQVAHNSSSSSSFSSYGGGIYTDSGNITLTNSQVTDNFNSSRLPSYGGGICTNSGSITLINSQVVNNSNSNNSSLSSSFGGGIYTSNGIVTLTNSLVAYNSTTTISSSSGSYGGGIYRDENSAGITLTNSIVARNIVSNTGFNALGGGVSGTTILQNSILWNNFKSTDYGFIVTASEHETGSLTANYSLIKGHFLNDITNTNNIDATIGGFNPLFVNEASGDFRLQMGSPLIDAGNDSFNTTLLDLDGNTRFVRTIDIGAYENLSSLSTHDYNLDGVYVFPNPTKDFITITNTTIDRVLVYDINGRKVLETTKTYFSIESLENGVYFVRAENSNKVAIRKIIKH
ncbi:LamG-like jellyroll fold domain-containing protein [uncultured Winogradskyella sp.]|uniref:LamG-like jellyroll fold domain-containing protein n=1 Tax=uncultured Winogradskyella sp. TaxID=395353 RepID=UPI00261BA2CF|nr:LamG-like jellyroll fold domain-containing protein [uncultured Winogradskyella sp.]